MVGNASRDISVDIAVKGASIVWDDVAGSECVVSGSCTDSVAGMKRTATEATIHMAHSQRVGLARICADLSNASAARPISKLATIE
jgi:hypothetical protein